MNTLALGERMCFVLVMNVLVLETSTLKASVQTSSPRSYTCSYMNQQFSSWTSFQIATHRHSPPKNGSSHTLVPTCEYAMPTSYMPWFAFLCWNIFVIHKNAKIFSAKVLLAKKLGNVESGQKLHSPLFSSLAAVYIFCLHVFSLKKERQLRPWISRIEYNAFRNILASLIFVRKPKEEKFLPKLFGFEINTDENKANCSIIYAIAFSAGIKVPEVD